MTAPSGNQCQLFIRISAGIARAVIAEQLPSRRCRPAEHLGDDAVVAVAQPLPDHRDRDRGDDPRKQDPGTRRARPPARAGDHQGGREREQRLHDQVADQPDAGPPQRRPEARRHRDVAVVVEPDERRGAAHDRLVAQAQPDGVDQRIADHEHHQQHQRCDQHHADDLRAPVRTAARRRAGLGRPATEDPPGRSAASRLGADALRISPAPRPHLLVAATRPPRPDPRRSTVICCSTWARTF